MPSSSEKNNAGVVQLVLTFAMHLTYSPQTDRRFSMRLLSASLLLLTPFFPAFAQDRGTIEGMVTDVTGSVIPAARIQIVQVGTNASWSLVANEVGRYYAPNLPLGNYTINAQKD